MACYVEATSTEEERGDEMKDLSLDVKLAFNRVCMLIDCLDDSEESLNLLRRIQMEARSVVRMRKRKDELNESQYINASTQVKGRSLQKSFFSEPITNEPREMSMVNNSFHGNNSHSRLLHTSLISEPISSKQNLKKGAQNKISLGTIPEMEEVEVITDDTSSISSIADSLYPETAEEDAPVLLKKWCVKKINKDLYITGVKIDRKGNILEKDFISEKVVARTKNDLVRTVDCDILLQEPIYDPKSIIPEEVKQIFTKEKFFPRNWRHAVELWNKLEQNTSNEKKKNDNKTNVRKTQPKKSLENVKVESQANKKNKRKSPKEDKGVRPKKKKSITPNDKKNRAGTKKTAKNNDAPKENVRKAPSKTKAVKPKAPVEEESDEQPSSKEEAENGEPFPPGLEGDSMFLMPQTSLTPSGLLNSMKRTSAKGRFTPPTDLFDNIYGYTHSNNSSLANTSPGSVTNKKSNVVKRLAKAKSNTKGQKLRQLNYVPIDDANQEIIGEVIRVAGTNPTRTPPLIKEVFRDNENSDYCTDSD